MRTIGQFILFMVCSAGILGAGERVENFRLLDHAGKSHELFRYKASRGVLLVVMGNGCPIVRHSIADLKAMRATLDQAGVRVLGLNSVPEDLEAEVRDEAHEFGVDFPILLDRDQIVAHALGIERTAEVLLIDTREWNIVYRGPMHDRLGYGTQKPAPGQAYLAGALEALKSGDPVDVPVRPTRGCAIRFNRALRKSGKSSTRINYRTEIAPILRDRCTECHRAGGIAPFAFRSHESVKKMSRTIREVLLEQRMPPWHADPSIGEFSNGHALRPGEAAKLMAWLDQDCPEFGGPDPLERATEAQAHAGGPWGLEEPDIVVGMPEPVALPATGLVPYHYSEVIAPVDEDVWVRGAVILPGNSKVVHHVLVFISYPEAIKHLEPKQDSGTEGFFAGFVPGTQPSFFPTGTAKFIPKGSKFTFQMHYTTTGKPESDQTRMGLYLAKRRPRMELVTSSAIDKTFEIPPRTPQHPVQAEFVFASESILFEFSPHMHYRGSWFEYEAIYPTGTKEILLSVPHYDFNWQHVYRLAKPKRVPAGTRLVCRGAFDNSPSNPSNPDPNAKVVFGEQTYDEMFIGYFSHASLSSPEARRRSED